MNIQTLSLKQKISYAASILVFLLIIAGGINGYFALKKRENAQKGTLWSWIPSSTRLLIDSKNGDLLKKELNRSAYKRTLSICEPFQSFEQYLSLATNDKGETDKENPNNELFLGAMTDVRENFMAIRIPGNIGNTLLKRMNQRLKNDSPIEKESPFHHYIYPPDKSRKDTLYIFIEKEIALVTKGTEVLKELLATQKDRTSLFDNREFSQLYEWINKGGEHRLMIHSSMMPDLSDPAQGKTLADKHPRWIGWNLTLDKSEIWLTGNSMTDADFYGVTGCSPYRWQQIYLIPANTSSFFLTHASQEQWQEEFPTTSNGSTDFWEQKGKNMIRAIETRLTGDIFVSQRSNGIGSSISLTGIGIQDESGLKDVLQKWIFTLSSQNKEYDPDIRKAITQPEAETIYRLPAGNLSSSLFGRRVPCDSIEYIALWKNTLFVCSHPLYLKEHLENLSLGRSFGQTTLFRQWNKSLNKEADLFLFYDTHKLLPLFNAPKDHWLFMRKNYLNRFSVGMQLRSQGEYISEYMVLRYR